MTLTEMDRIKEYAWCSGSCGGVTDSNPEFAEWTAAERLEEAASTGAEAIVTASPWSEKLFAETIAKQRRQPQGLRHRRTGRRRPCKEGGRYVLTLDEGYPQRLRRRRGGGEPLRRPGDDDRLLQDRLRRRGHAQEHGRSPGGGPALQQVQAAVPADLHRLGPAWLPPGIVLIDLRRMNQIIEINEKNMYAVVEPYVTSAQLQAELFKRGLNTNIKGAGLPVLGHAARPRAPGPVHGRRRPQPSGRRMGDARRRAGQDRFAGDRRTSGSAATGPGPSLRCLIQGVMPPSLHAGRVHQGGHEALPLAGAGEVPVEG